jgi:hypothetical protein
MKSKFPSYVLDKKLRLQPGPETKTLNFPKHKDLMLSKDLSRLPEFRKICESEAMLLDSNFNMAGNKISMATFQRNGNTFLRSYIEKCTGMATGSDQDLLFSIND